MTKENLVKLADWVEANATQDMFDMANFRAEKYEVEGAVERIRFLISDEYPKFKTYCSKQDDIKLEDIYKEYKSRIK
jgi:hypothetical protein